MARFWGGTIGAIPLIDTDGETAGFELTGAAAFVSAFTGQMISGASGFQHKQVVALTAGQVIELSFLHIPATLLQSLITLLTPLIPLSTGVACSFTDGFQTVSGSFTPALPNWYSRGNPDGDYINDAIIRLIKIGD